MTPAQVCLEISQRYRTIMLHKVYEIAGVEKDFHKRRLIDSSRILIVGGMPTRQSSFDDTVQ
jgi:hypothetical protein